MKKFFAILVVYIIMFSTSMAFSDIDESHWGYQDVMKMQEKGIVSGFVDNTFKPDKNMTREEAATILTNALELKLRTKHIEYNDVAANRWSRYYVDIASQYIDSEPENFNPEKNILRADIAKALVRILNIENENSDIASLNVFSDVDKLSADDAKYIAIVYGKGIMAGKGDFFDAYSGLTRAEMCAIISNLMDKKDTINNIDNQIVMTVNNEKVTVSDFKVYLKIQSKFYETLANNKNIWNTETQDKTLYNAIKGYVKDELAANIVKSQKAKELNITLSDEELEKLEKALESNDLTEMCEYYGITLSDLEKLNKESMIFDNLATVIYSKIDHTDHTHADINQLVDRTFYDVKHILISTFNKTDDELTEAKKLAEELLDRAKKGEDFSKLAEEYSQDAGSKTNGGLYENVSLGEFIPEFEEAALATEIGNIYPEPVETAYGYHIIKTINKGTEKIELDEQTKKDIIYNDFAQEVKKWIESAKIDINEDLYNQI